MTSETVPSQIPGFYRHPGVKPQCEPFARLHGNKEVVAFFHGFTGTPHDFRSYVEAYEEAGFDVVVPLLPGHGSHVSHLERLTFRELYIPFEPINDYLRERYERVHLVGLSYGAVLTANLALNRKPDSISFLAPAFYLTKGTEKNMRFVRRFHIQKIKSRVAKSVTSGNKNFRPHPYTYGHIPFQPATDLHARAEGIREQMREQEWEVYHAHGTVDATTDMAYNKQFLEGAFSDYTFYRVENGTHVLPLSAGSAELAQHHLQWLKRSAS